MRTFTRSIVAYLLLFILVIAFAMWGINDVFRSVGGNNLAEVNGVAIAPARLTRELELTLQSQRLQGRNVSQADAVRAGLHRRILESLIARTALGVYAERIHIGTSNAQVGERIREIPRTQNPVSGVFDRNEYARFLREMRYTEQDFETDVRADLTSGMLLQSLTAGLRAPSSFGAMELVFNSETRTLSVAELPISAAGTVAPPTDAQAQAFYQENQQMFQVPELRTFSIVYARPSDFAARVSVPEARIREVYEQRRAQLTTPERRTFVRLSAQTEAQANQAAQRLARGEASDAVAAALGLQVARGADQSRDQVSDAGVAELVFSTAPNAPPRVGRGRLSPWVVVKVESVTPGSTATFESQRDEIRTALANEEAGNLMDAARNAFDDATAAGTPTGQAAREAGLTVETFTNVAADGSGAPPEQQAALRGAPEILRTAFETAEGQASDFFPVEDTDILVAVDRVTAATVRPLTEVRQQVGQIYIVRETVRRLQERATAIQTAVEGGTPFAQAVSANRGAIIARSQSIDRASAAQGLPRRFGALVFSAPQGGVVSDMRPDGRAVLVAHVERIQRADPAQQREAVEAVRTSSSQESLQQSLVDALQAQIMGSVRIRRNTELLDRQYPPEGGEEGEQQPAQ
ncbi:SurA N-terminal domain-containing protein [Terricaulis sp.]|uniref:peptidylprolyl isomerase n=1 Tax=Terricaulis sp. TaxID=2768686 RepID=UPI003783A518